MYKLWANDTYREVWAVRYGRGHRIDGVRRVQPDIAAADLPNLDYQTDAWRLKWFSRNIMHFREVQAGTPLIPCPSCGSRSLVLITPLIAGPDGWARRCKMCGHRWDV